MGKTYLQSLNSLAARSSVYLPGNTSLIQMALLKPESQQLS